MKGIEWAKKHLDEAKKQVEFSVEEDALDFTEQISGLMRIQGISKADLARKLERSRAYVTRVLSGSSNQNLTLKTMESFVMALNAKLTISVDPDDQSALVDDSFSSHVMSYGPLFNHIQTLLEANRVAISTVIAREPSATSASYALSANWTKPQRVTEQCKEYANDEGYTEEEGRAA